MTSTEYEEILNILVALTESNWDGFYITVALTQCHEHINKNITRDHIEFVIETNTDMLRYYPSTGLITITVQDTIDKAIKSDTIFKTAAETLTMLTNDNKFYEETGGITSKNRERRDIAEYKRIVGWMDEDIYKIW